MAEFAQILIRAKDETKTAFDSAARNMRGLQESAGRLSGVLGSIGIGAGLSSAGFALFAKRGIDAADALNDMSVRLGVSVKDLASFQLAADQSGTSLEGIGKGIQKLTLSMGQAEQGLSTQAKALKTLGITARDPKEAFFQLADAVANSNDPIKTNAALNDVLGRSYGELLPLLSQGSEALRKSARDSETFAEAMSRLAPDADKFNDQLAAMKINAAGLSAALIAQVVPSLNEYLGALQKITHEGTLLEKIGFFTLGFIPAHILDEQAASVSEIGDRIASYRARIAELKASNQDASKETAILNGLIEKQVKLIQTPPKRPGSGIDLSAATGKPKSKAADPLAGLLASTDIGRLQAFDKQVALLNARFDSGRKNTELYNQAMTKLVETTFSANFTEFNKQLADQDETQRLVAEHLKATNDELYAQQQAWSDAGAALTDEMRTPLENANIEFGRLQDLLDRGVISWDTYTRAVMKTQDAIEETPDKLKELDTFAKKAAENIQDGFANFFKNFDKGTKGMLQSFGETVKGMIADAAAADLTRWLFGDLVQGGKGSGVAGGLLSKIGSVFDAGAGNGQNLFGDFASLFGFANGGSFAVGGSGGTDSQLVAFRATPGEMVDVRTPGQASSGGHTIINNFYGIRDSQDVRNASGHVSRSAVSALERAQRYG